MRHANLSPRPSSHPFKRLRAFGAALLPLVLAVALPACGVHECGAVPWLPAPALTVADGVVYAQGAADIADLRAGAGTIAWRSTIDITSGRARPAPPALADGFVIASSGFGTLIARRLSDGSLAWRSQALPRPWGGDSQFLPTPTVAGGVVYAAASPDAIAAWHVADGMLLWQSPPLISTTDQTWGSTYSQVPEPVVAGNVIYFVAGAVVCAIRATDGALLWSTSVTPAPGLPKPLRYAPPVIADGRLFLVVADGSLSALNTATGAVLWHTPDPDLATTPTFYQHPASFAPPIVRDGVVYYAPLLRIRALDAATGHLIWRFPVYACPPTSAPVVAGGVVYVTMQACLTSWHIQTGGALAALDAHTGAIRWIVGIQPNRLPGTTILVHGDAVYTISAGDGIPNYTYTYVPGVVAAWSVSKGAPLWQRAIQSPSPDFQQVAFADGVIYLSTDGAPDLPAGCGGIRIQPAISALRASDGALLWQTFVPAA